MSEDLKISLEHVVMECPRCGEQAKNGLTVMTVPTDEHEDLAPIEVFRGCRICLHKELDKNPMAKVLHQALEREQESHRFLGDQVDALAEFLMEKTNHPKYDEGACHAAIRCIREKMAELELYEIEGTQVVKSQRDFLLGGIEMAKLDRTRKLIQLAIDFFPEKYYGRIDSAHKRLVDLRDRAREVKYELSGSSKADPSYRRRISDSTGEMVEEHAAQNKLRRKKWEGRGN